MKLGMKQVLVIVLAMTILSGCGRDVIASDDFKSYMEDKGYEIVDSTDQYAGIGDVHKGYIALVDSNNDGEIDYQIEWLEVKNIEDAILLFEQQKVVSESYKGNSSSESNVNRKNYSEYSITYNGIHINMIRVENTLVYVMCDEEYKDNVKEDMKQIGY